MDKKIKDLELGSTSSTCCSSTTVSAEAAAQGFINWLNKYEHGDINKWMWLDSGTREGIKIKLTEIIQKELNAQKSILW